MSEAVSHPDPTTHAAPSGSDQPGFEVESLERCCARGSMMISVNRDGPGGGPYGGRA